MGIPGEVDHPKVSAAVDKLVEACKSHGKWAGIGGVYEPRLLTRHISQGVKMILAGNDVTLLLDAATEKARLIRDCDKR
jgi:2-keto-3-deoxy-L-rhamnonate aldolase RhmA